MNLKELMHLLTYIKQQRDWCNYQINMSTKKATTEHYISMRDGYEEKIKELESKIENYG